jgi:hypothetical protein
MERKKLYNETALEDLLQAASEETEEQFIDDGVFKTDIPSFIIKYELKAGDKIASGNILYTIYKHFSDSPVNRSSFSREFSLYFNQQKGYYLINKDPSELIADYSQAIKKKRIPRIRQKSTKLQFEAFLAHHNIAKGEEWIEAHVIQHHYDKWTYNEKKKRRIANEDLLALMRIFFENRKTRDGYVFKLTHGFSKETIENLRIAWKRKRRKDQG